MVHCSESDIDVHVRVIFPLLWGLVYLLVFLRKDINHFGFFCLIRLLVGEGWLPATDCFCGWFAEARL